MYLRRVVHVLWNSLLFWQMMMMIDLAFSSSTHTVRQVIKYRFSNTFIATKSWMKLSERLNKISKCAIYEKLNFFRDTTLRNYQGYGSIKPFCCLFWTHNLTPIWMGHPGLYFAYFQSFQTIYRIKTVDFSRIRTRIVRIGGGKADHLTTTTGSFSQIW